MFLTTLDKSRAMNKYDYATTRTGRFIGFVAIARANGLSWLKVLEIVRAWNAECWNAVTSPHRLMFPRY